MLFNIFRRKKDRILEIAQKEMRENFDVLESLRKYDKGEKEISTREIETRLPDIRIAPQK